MTSIPHTEVKAPPDDGVDVFIEVQKSGLPERAPVLIEGILRQGHKMQIAAPSKAGKTFLFTRLALALNTGGCWLGRSCRKCRVLLVNMELSRPSMLHRVATVAEQIDISPDGGLIIMHRRGKRDDPSQLKAAIAQCVEKHGAVDAILIDPIYKLNGGDENSARDIGNLVSAMDTLSEMTGASILYTHHFSKGLQGGKAAIDRAAGSGVWSRDADAIGTLTEADAGAGVTGGRYCLEWVLREFATPSPVLLTWKYPIHEVGEWRADDRVAGAAGRPAKTQSRSVEQHIHEIAVRLGVDPRADGVPLNSLGCALDCSPKTLTNKAYKGEAVGWTVRGQHAHIQ
jgi:RecA-family ATPase